jgi:hypothetical protein
MSDLIAAPDMLATAAADAASIGSSLREAHTAAASQTTAIAAPAADEVSAGVTALFGAHAQEFQALSTKAAAFHDEFVNLLNGGAAQYLTTEVANAKQMLVNTVNGPAQALLGHPLIGTGQGSVGSAAANPAAAIFNGSFGPFQISVDQTLLPSSEITNAALTLNTPFGIRLLLGSASGNILVGNGAITAIGNATVGLGPVGLWSETLSGSLYNFAPDFSSSFSASIIQTAPFGPLGFGVTGFLPPAGQPQITGWTVDLFGLEL